MIDQTGGGFRLQVVRHDRFISQHWLPFGDCVLLCVAEDETSAEIMCRGYVVISCGKVYYDKSGWRDD
jgi:hypothetical protein